MKKRKILKCSLAMALVFGSVGIISGCDKDDDSSSKEGQYAIYELAVDAGYTGTYDQWLIAINGNRGEDGATWISGVVSPSNDIGKNGDFYFDTVAQKIYSKNNDVWGLVTTISDGKGISNVTKTTVENIDTYTILYTDGSQYSFSVKNGTEAKNVEFRVDNGFIQWSYVGANSWNNLIELKELKGEKIVFDVIEDSIVWKHESDSSWQQLVDLDSLKGDRGTEWLSGEDIPGNEEGREGDFYFVTSDKSIYKKIDGAWEFISAISDGEKGEDGTSWIVGEGFPLVNAKIGDFYYDKLNNDIYLYTNFGWRLEVDLIVNEEKMTKLNDGIYTGIFDNNMNFEMEIENNNIKSLKINGNDTEYSSNSFYSISNNKIRLNFIIPVYEDDEYVEDTIIDEYYVLDYNNRLVKYINDEEVDLLKGVYFEETGNSPLTFSDSKFVFTYKNNYITGTWEVVDVINNDGDISYRLLLTGDNMKFTVLTSYFTRTYDLENVECDFTSRMYSYNDTVVTFSYSEDKYLLRIDNGQSFEVNICEFKEEMGLLYLESVDGSESYVLDFFSKKLLDANSNNYPIIGKMVYIEDDYENLYHLEIESNELSLANQIISVYNGDYKLDVDTETQDLSIYLVGENALEHIVTLNRNEFTWNGQVEAYYNEGEYEIKIELNDDLTLKNVVVNVYELCNDGDSFIAAIDQGKEYIRIMENITVSDTVLINDGSYVIDLNGHIISSGVNYLEGAIIKVQDNDDGVDAEINVTIKNGYIGNYVLNEENIELLKTSSPSGNVSKNGIAVHGGVKTVVNIENLNIAGYEVGLITSDLEAFSGATINIINSYVYSTTNDSKDGIGAYLADYATYIVENTKFEGATGMYAKSGEITLINCEVVATGDKAEPVHSNNGALPTGSALVLDSSYGYVNPLNVTIDGGTYTSANNYAIEEIASAPDDVEAVDYTTITGIDSATLIASEDNDVATKILN